MGLGFGCAAVRLKRIEQRWEVVGKKRLVVMPSVSTAWNLGQPIRV
jgi:hypothetical protein